MSKDMDQAIDVLSDEEEYVSEEDNDFHEGSIPTDNFTLPELKTLGELDHPYKEKILAFEPTEEMMTQSEVDSPMTLLETPFTEINTKEELEKLAEKLENATELGVGLEWNKSGYSTVICMLELSTFDEDFLIDAIALKDDLHVLSPIFANEKCVKIFYHSNCMLYSLQIQLNLYCVNVFSILRTMRLSCVKSTIGPQVNAQFRRTRTRNAINQCDFKKRPIEQAAKDLCRHGSHYLIPMYYQLKNCLLSTNPEYYKMFLKRNNLHCLVRYNDNSIIELKQLVCALEKRQQFQLQILDSLENWREAKAKAEGKKPDEILNRDRLKWLVTDVPRKETTIMQIANSQYAYKDKAEFLKCFVSMPLFWKSETLMQNHLPRNARNGNYKGTSYQARQAARNKQQQHRYQPFAVQQRGYAQGFATASYNNNQSGYRYF